jgi:hypothetical protein
MCGVGLRLAGDNGQNILANILHGTILYIVVPATYLTHVPKNGTGRGRLKSIGQFVRWS